MLCFYHSTYPTDIVVDPQNETHLELVLLLKECDNYTYNLSDAARSRLSRLFAKVFGPDLKPRTDVSLWNRDETTGHGYPLRPEELATVFPQTF